MGIIAAKRLVTPEFNVTRVHVRHGRAATEGIVGRREPFLTRLIGMDSEVVAETGGIMGTCSSGSEYSKQSEPSGELVVYAHSALHSSAAAASPTTEGDRDTEIAALVRGDDREAVAEGVVKEVRLGDEAQAREAESRGVDVPLGMGSIRPDVPVTGEDP